MRISRISPEGSRGVTSAVPVLDTGIAVWRVALTVCISREALCTTGYSPFLAFSVDDLQAGLTNMLRLGGRMDGAIKYTPQGKVCRLLQAAYALVAIAQCAKCLDCPEDSSVSHCWPLECMHMTSRLLKMRPYNITAENSDFNRVLFQWSRCHPWVGVTCQLEVLCWPHCTPMWPRQCVPLADCCYQSSRWAYAQHL